MISQGWKNQRRSEEEAPLQIKRVATRESTRAHWVDAMLGHGSSKTVDSAVGRFQRAKGEATAPLKTMRLRALGSETEPGAGAKSKGYLRLGLASLTLVAVVMRFNPWQAASSIHLPELVHVDKQAEVEPKSALIDAGGAPLALWRSEAGHWHGVNARAELSRLSEAEANSRLSLPRIEGCAVRAIEKRGGHVMALAVDPAQLAELLPLRPDLVAEVDSVLVQGKDIKLKTHGGSIVELGEGDFKKKQLRLVALLADIEARKKRALSVDLRFENSAVVRLASR